MPKSEDEPHKKAIIPAMCHTYPSVCDGDTLPSVVVG